MKCKKCGIEFEDQLAACPKCGEKAACAKKKKPIWLLFIIIPLALIILGGGCFCGIGGIAGGGALLGIFNLKLDASKETPSASRLDQTASTTPDCIGGVLNDAQDALTEAGYEEVRVNYEYSDEYSKDVVFYQSVEAGDPVSEDKTITLTVSLGADLSGLGYNQRIQIQAVEGSPMAYLLLSEWKNGEWTDIFACSAVVGKNGISEDCNETNKTTPAGDFPLGFVMLPSEYLGSNNLNVMVIDKNDCIVDDTDSPLYNTLQNIAELPRGTHYDPIGDTIVNGDASACIFIEHNGDGFTEGGAAGKGSAITICGVDSLPTYTSGCVDIASWDMDTLISLLDYNKNPHIILSCIPLNFGF